MSGGLDHSVYGKKLYPFLDHFIQALNLFRISIRYLHPYNMRARYRHAGIDIFGKVELRLGWIDGHISECGVDLSGIHTAPTRQSQFQLDGIVAKQQR